MTDLLRLNKEGQPGAADSYHQRLMQLLGRNDDETKQHEPIASNLRVILETAKQIGQMDSIPTNLKYWF